ncbi:MAG: hypothetical protein JRH13_09410 [Deltaproteobacteria bacterium]|nr:hypothetical protein [Deltaproteobacteria bacterium]MBW2302438.1 hypothetical protein [Deltaproteobacteria bacterium]
MQCERCGDAVPAGEERELHGQILCEDCYMDFLSPPKACDPWAVHSAKSFTRKQARNVQLNPVQQKILRILEEQGPVEPGRLAKRLQIKPTDLEREIAALRHMEKVRGALRDGKRVLLPWDQPPSQ